MGGAVASWLVCSTPKRTVRVRVLSRDIVLCSWASHFTLTLPLSTQAYKWVPASCWGNLTNCGAVTCDGLASRPGEVEILLAPSCYRNRDKLRQLWASHGSKASLIYRISRLVFNFISVTRSLRSHVRYQVEHSKRNSMSTCTHVLFSIDHGSCWELSFLK